MKHSNRREVLDCGSPLPLSHRTTSDAKRQGTAELQDAIVPHCPPWIGCRLLLLLSLLLAPSCVAAETPADAQLKKYFQTETVVLSEACLADINSLEDWTMRRAEFRRQYQEMLGLFPFPERADLKPVITGKLEHAEFTVEKLQFQALPGLYCTAALFIPKNITKPAPTILYECGHWKVIQDGVSYGNKAAYQRDGAWYARNGYVCLVLDTVLAGEIQGIHTGTRDHGLWWWNSRGYTPAGVEAWFGIRALDYLSTRPEVDTNRFGITGHSGGGAYSWAVTALDDRIKVAAPLAGMADLRAHVIEGIMDSHCDCNFPINFYRWDFPQIAALAAPRPLLIGGTDNDRLFNLQNTLRIHDKVRRIYQLHKATDKLGLAIAPGPHDEVPELQLAVLHWFNRFLKSEEKTPITVNPTNFFLPQEIKVFAELPTDSINTNIADTFVPLAEPKKRSAAELTEILRNNVFRGWPADDLPLEPKLAYEPDGKRMGFKFTAWDFTSQREVILRLYLVDANDTTNKGPVKLVVLDQDTADKYFGEGGKLYSQLSRTYEAVGRGSLDRDIKEGSTVAFFAPRGIGLTSWSGDAKAERRIRRRFMALGQTLDGMRAWDIRRAIQTIHFIRESDLARIHLHAVGEMGVNALYASLFEPAVVHLELAELPTSHAIGPDYLGILRFTDISEVLSAVRVRAVVRD